MAAEEALTRGGIGNAQVANPAGTEGPHSTLIRPCGDPLFGAKIARMIRTRRLSEDEFTACSDERMEDVTSKAEAKVDIWPYVDALDLDDLGVPGLNDVNYVYRDGRGRYDQILIGTGRFNSLLVVVVDLASATIYGHYLLDLNKMYSVQSSHLRAAD